MVNTRKTPQQILLVGEIGGMSFALQHSQSARYEVDRISIDRSGFGALLILRNRSEMLKFFVRVCVCVCVCVCVIRVILKIPAPCVRGG